mmetsp:Transcript_103806/g.289121  ORF Transcript_103806/g.289121 Transcript_103806/m.289121 type:complete len:206 (-) Transcript_103806:581-1198(-)
MRGDGHGLRCLCDLLHLLADVLISNQLVCKHLLVAAGATAVLYGVRLCQAVDDAVAAEGGPATRRERGLPKHLVAQWAPQRLLHFLGALREGSDHLLLHGVADAQLLVLVGRLVREDVVAAVPRQGEGHTPGAQLLALLNACDLAEEVARDALGRAHLLHVVRVLVRGALPNPVALGLAADLPATVARVVRGRRLQGLQDTILLV